jgi:hypothetical protein
MILHQEGGVHRPGDDTTAEVVVVVEETQEAMGEADRTPGRGRQDGRHHTQGRDQYRGLHHQEEVLEEQLDHHVVVAVIGITELGTVHRREMEEQVVVEKEEGGARAIVATAEAEAEAEAGLHLGDRNPTRAEHYVSIRSRY